jgi:NarL family two-component system response regulator YdfI
MVTSVLVVAASSAVRASLAAVIAAEPALVLAGTFGWPPTLLEYGRARADVVVVDLLDAEEAAVWEWGLPAPRFVLLVDEPDGDAAQRVLRADAAAILPRDAAAQEIVAAIECAALGLVAMRWSTLAALIGGHGAAGRFAAAPQLTETLTPRELEVLQMLGEGLANRAIAGRLGISVHTAKFHVGSILGKLGAATRAEAVALGIRRGLIML